ncbi:MAG TPA: class I SAM-dependent methyltransferase family protein [Candidatus Bathyarchaeia archaeon]|nr:class I SAM-dependent methyltransferase family protein [Candidatus Bathyarchaeia archaeon]
MQKTAFCLKVSKKHGETALAFANKLGVLDKSLKIERDETNLRVPLVRSLEEKELATLKRQVAESLVEMGVFIKKQPAVVTLTQTLETKLPPHLLAILPQALDIVGDIAVIEIQNELKTYEKTIGEAILKTHKNIKTVLAKAGSVSGTFRVRMYDFIAGEQKTTTTHREFGCQYRVDLAKAYFSPRLSSEHMRVASIVHEGETVVDLFAGVGPFSVLIGKKNLDVRVFAVDINPEAVELSKVNVRLNRVENRVFPVLGDARQLAASRLSGSADRVIMNLPETAIEFVDAACQVVKPTGGVIHFYGFVRSPDSPENLKLRFSNVVKKAGRKVETFLCVKNVRETAPYECQIVLDAKIS